MRAGRPRSQGARVDAGGTPAIPGRGGLAIRHCDPGARVWELPTVKR